MPCGISECPAWLRPHLNLFNSLILKRFLYIGLIASGTVARSRKRETDAPGAIWRCDRGVV